MSSQPVPSTINIYPTPQDLNDLQGDVVLGIPKRYQDFVFFRIQDATSFKKHLKVLIPAITTTAQVQKIRSDISLHKSKGHQGLLKVIGINISFTFDGLKALGITDSLGDDDFKAGQLAHAENLGDQGTTDANGNFVPNWLAEFKGEIHGLVFAAGDSKESVHEGISKVEHVLGTSIKQVLKVEGNVRPGKEKGHEHFGFMDGISVPAIDALTGHLPGQQVVKPGVLICSQDGDSDASGNIVVRPDWAKNGSFLAYRQLEQLVPEFNKFLADNPLDFPGLPRDKGSELLGARFVGRWKSGAPIDITPVHDDAELAADPTRNNFFDFSNPKDQTNCPFSAHIRKTNPRSDLKDLFGDNAVEQHMIMRQGIPFGPEVTPDEAHTNTTKLTRGLSFVCYQSNLSNGFEFVQERWANATGFPPQKIVNGKPFNPGFDPIIGQNGNNPRSVGGVDPKAQGNSLPLPFDFVVSRGGAYFFVPSISALETKFAA